MILLGWLSPRRNWQNTILLISTKNPRWDLQWVRLLLWRKYSCLEDPVWTPSMSGLIPKAPNDLWTMNNTIKSNSLIFGISHVSSNIGGHEANWGCRSTHPVIRRPPISSIVLSCLGLDFLGDFCVSPFSGRYVFREPGNGISMSSDCWFEPGIVGDSFDVAKGMLFFLAHHHFGLLIDSELFFYLGEGLSAMIHRLEHDLMFELTPP